MNNYIKPGKIKALKFKKRVLFCCFKNMFKTFVLKQAYISKPAIRYFISHHSKWGYRPTMGL